MFRGSYSRQSAGVKITMLSLLTASLLSGCGIRGGLKTPPPLFGDTKVDPARVPGSDFDKKDVEDDDLFIDDPFIDDPFSDDPFADDPLPDDPLLDDPATNN